MKRALTVKEIETLRHIRNFLVNEGKVPSIRELMTALGYRSPHSAAVIVNRLVTMGLLGKRDDGRIRINELLVEDDRHANTVDIPLIGRITAGSPILAEENIEAYISVSTRLARPPHQYYLLKVIGDSMDEAGIDDGDFILVRRQSTANNGDKVVALIDNEATVKAFQRGKSSVVLKPRSSNSKHKAIVVTSDFQVQGVVVAIVPKL